MARWIRADLLGGSRARSRSRLAENTVVARAVLSVQCLGLQNRTVAINSTGKEENGKKQTEIPRVGKDVFAALDFTVRSKMKCFNEDYSHCSQSMRPIF